MKRYESSPSGGRRPVVLASLTLFLIGAGIIGLFYGDQVVAFASGKLLGSADARIQKRIALFETEYNKSGRSPAELLDLVESSRKIVQLMEREKPASAEVYYYYSLLNYYEILIRVPLDGPSLLRLTGRGYLPDSPPGLNLPPVSISALAQETASLARKSLAIDPEPPFASRLKAALSLGELLSTGRTDPHLLAVTMSIKREDLTKSMTDSNDWIRWALFALQGKAIELEQELNERKMLQDFAPPPAPDSRTIEHISLDVNESRLLMSHACLVGRDYIRALNFARLVKFNASTEPIWKIDAARVEGEIFLAQSGPLAAKPYLEEALKLSDGKDKFVEERIQQIFGPVTTVRQAP
ncbi:MAG: hypothetical protein JNM27_17700 [Leptospirales bacterium]|nr:hypothetical protein [Leptospirales bacterium]